MREGPPGFLLVVTLLILLLAGSCCLPLRREEPPAPAREMNPRPSGAMSGCSICHVDVEIESGKSKHIAAGIGCSDCHGKSEGHIRDENNNVKPDRVFARSRITSFCGDCHECSLPPEDRPLRKVCTDCHGAHSTSVSGK